MVREPYDHRIFRFEVLWAVRGLIRGASWGRQETIYWLENFLLFMPFGFLFPEHKSWKHIAVTAAGFSAFIELSQYAFILGECELDDVFANTIGALIGYLLFVTFRKIFYRGKSRV